MLISLSNNPLYLWYDPFGRIHRDPSHCHSILSACLLPNCCVYLTPLCLTGDLHRDSRHAALWCFLHGLSLHNGEQQRQRYCPIHFCSQSVFANLAASPFFLYTCRVLRGSARCFLPIYSVLSLTSLFVPPILFSLSNKPPGDLKKEPVLFESQPPGPWPFLSSLSTQTYLEGNCHSVFSLCWHVFEFLSPRCLLKHCFPLSFYL